MNALATAAAVCFWTCAALIVYTYAVYPPLIWLLSRSFGRKTVAPPPGRDDELPTVSLIFAAYNEEPVIEARLLNALAMDYPAAKLEILVASDGSTDRTAEIVRGYAGRGVRLLDFVQNRGKSSVLNSAVAGAHGEIVLMSDANTDVDPSAARRLVRWFEDPRVGVVVGRLRLVDHHTGRNADGLYWKYETFLKTCEGRLGALLGANGAIYALRKCLYEPIPAATIVDDFVISLLAKLKTGCEIIYDREAVAVEESAPDLGSEFHRRARIGAGGFQSIGMLWKLLDPKRGWVAFTFLSHKILRWFCPFFLVGILAGNLVLLGNPFFRVIMIMQAVFYATSLLMVFVPARARVLKPLRLATMFTGMNAALMVGFWRWLSGRQNAAWKRTERVGEAGGVTR